MNSPERERPPVPLVARNDGEVFLRPVLGLTAYLDEPAWWATEGARRALELFLSRVPGERLSAYTTSAMTHWKALSNAGLEHAREVLTSWRYLANQPRHHFQLRIADIPNAPELGFAYTEIDPARARRAAVLELTLPATAPSEHLWELARGLVELGPVASLVGGHVARWSPLHRRLAFEHFFFWSHRYLGLDIQDPEPAAYSALTGLSGINWLVYVADALLTGHELEPETLLQRRWAHEVSVTRCRSGVLVRAGPRPLLGDLNALTVPKAYYEAAQALEPLLTALAPPFPGRWAHESLTRRWRLRFSEPGGWPP